jgi:glycosyltransferase involved in cell wall biosynthesis
VPGLKLAVGGGCQPFDKAFVAEQKQRLRDAGLLGDATFSPNLDRDAKLAFYRKLTVLSVPATYGEAFGLYVVEAMASGVPVVAPDDASFPELIEQNQAGVICEKGSAAALADAIGQLLLDRERLAKCAAAGRQAAVQTHNIERMAESFVARLAKLR